MSTSRYKASGSSNMRQPTYDVLDMADDGRVILADVPQDIVIDVVEALNRAYESGVEDGTEAAIVFARDGRGGTFVNRDPVGPWK